MAVVTPLPRPKSFALPLVALLAGALSAAPAAAQVHADFYLGAPTAAPTASAPFFAGATPFCTVDFSAFDVYGNVLDRLTFGDRYSVANVCHGPIPPAEYSIRFVGSFIAPTAGTYQGLVGTDDGRVLTVNGVVYESQWADNDGRQINVMMPLHAGANAFTLDYYANASPVSLVNVRVVGTTLGGPVAAAPTATVPEPGSVALLAIGLAGLVAVARRRRAA